MSDSRGAQRPLIGKARAGVTLYLPGEVKVSQTPHIAIVQEPTHFIGVIQ